MFQQTVVRWRYTLARVGGTKIHPDYNTWVTIAEEYCFVEGGTEWANGQCTGPHLARCTK